MRPSDDARQFLGAGTCPACGSVLFPPTRNPSSEDDAHTRIYRRVRKARWQRDVERLSKNETRWFEHMNQRVSRGADMDGPSPHLSWSELACHDGTPYPMMWRTTRAVVLATEFEALRQLCGNVPLTILSAYRTPVWNRRVGGAQRSQHLEGRALDIQCPPGLTLQQFERLARSRYKTPGSRLRGIGVYPNFLHIDTRTTTRLVVWYGVRQLADAAADPV